MASFSLAGLFPTVSGLSPHRPIILPPVLHRSSFAISFLHPLLRIGTHFVVEFPCDGVSKMCPPTRKKSLKNGSKRGKWKRREVRQIIFPLGTSNPWSKRRLTLPEISPNLYLVNWASIPDHLLPRVTIVGRPNVGKSALFNRLVGAAIRPPTFVFFVNDAKLFPETYRRYMEKQLRKDAGYPGTPIRLLWRSRRRRDKGKLADTNCSASTNEKMLL